jgi:hypothetical protein
MLCFDKVKQRDDESMLEWAHQLDLLQDARSLLFEDKEIIRSNKLLSTIITPWPCLTNTYLARVHFQFPYHLYGNCFVGVVIQSLEHRRKGTTIILQEGMGMEKREYYITFKDDYLLPEHA